MGLGIWREVLRVDGSMSATCGISRPPHNLSRKIVSLCSIQPYIIRSPARIHPYTIKSPAHIYVINSLAHVQPYVIISRVHNQPYGGSAPVHVHPYVEAATGRARSTRRLAAPAWVSSSW